MVGWFPIGGKWPICDNPEVITGSSRTLSALLARPDARARLTAMIPTWETDISSPENAVFFQQHHDHASEVLGLVSALL